MRRFVRSLFATMLVVLASAAGPALADDRPIVSGEVGKRLDEYLTRLERFGFSGGALAVRGKDVLLKKSYGLADRARNIPLTTASVYNLGSITKQFTAAAILTLEMQGRLAVTDLASKYLDGVPADKAAITLHHLLTHSSGLESDFSPTDYEPVGREEYVRRALQSTLLFPPGSGYEYSNAGYSLLAAIVEKVSGTSYETYLIEHVLKPAGMLETGYKAPAWAASRIAHGYRDGQDWGTILKRIEPPEAPYWMLRGNGGLHTTLDDMLAWHRALNSDAVLSKEARAKYVKPYVAEGPAARSFYAYGWAVGKTVRGTTVVQHNGGNGVYVAEFLRFPDEDAMLFLTSTNAEMKASPVVQVLDRILFGGAVAMPPVVVTVTPETLAPLAGRWTLPGGGAIAIAADGNALAVRADDQEAMAALVSPPAGQAERFAQLTSRTADISSRSFKGDRSGLREAMGGERTLEDVKTQEAGMMRDREQRLGRFVKSAVLGTVPRGGDTVQTIVRLDFEKASVFNIYVWGPRRLLGILGMPQLPALRYLPVSNRRFVVYSLEMGGAEQALSFATTVGETVLVLQTPAGPVTARRKK
ncbi:MAG: serine hydrolase [Acidobacteria bacterium]|nr:serine hydrolase [Acidobacteriota bacterium]